MTIGNIFLLKTNKALKTEIMQSREVATGQYVDLLSGLDEHGNAISIKPSSYKKTVVLVFSPTCPYCQVNWPKWSALVDGKHDSRVQFVLVDLTSSSTNQFIVSKGLGKATLIKKLDSEQIKSLNLSETPQTIVIGPDSKVAKVFSGVLSEGSVILLNNMLS